MKQVITQEAVQALAKEVFGMVPNVIRQTAEKSPHTAWLYANGTAVMEQASFTGMEMNAIELKVSALNQCEDCIKGHSYLLSKEGFSDADIRSVISSGRTASEKIDTLIRATEYIYHAGSGEYPDHVLQFLSDNLTEKEIFDIVGLISLKTISNYINNYFASVKKATLQQA